MKSINFLQQEVITFCHTVLCRLYNKSHLLAFLIMLFHSNAKNYYVSSTFKITFGKTFFLTLQHFSVHSFLYHELWFANISLLLCAIWYHMHNLKNVKNNDGGVLLLVKLQTELSTLLKVALLHRYFSRFLKLYKWYQIVQSVTCKLEPNVLRPVPAYQKWVYI